MSGSDTSGAAVTGSAAGPATIDVDAAAARAQWVFEARGWRPLPFQRDAWEAFLAGRDTLITVPTGSGKTLAAVLGPLVAMAQRNPGGLQLLYLSPLRAVARDITRAIHEAVVALALDVRVESRTGDTASRTKKTQLLAPPEVLVTTPESLAIMLSHAGSARAFRNLRAVVLDEWHELLSTKRGTLAELCLTKLRSLAPDVVATALSATVANAAEAARAASGTAREPHVIRASLARDTRITSLVPERIDTFPWAGHLGAQMNRPLVDALDIERSTLIFTNTRRNAERWYQLLVEAAPDLRERIALHHGSIARAERERVEEGVRGGTIRWVVCTSSLDLGVDFQPVERIVQVGSAKGVARLLQRAGRSAHVPGGASEVLFVPTHALELLEISAIRRAIHDGAVEPRAPLRKPYDVLAQHLVTLAAGDGFQPDAAFAEVRTAVAYEDLTRDEFDSVLALVERGGKALCAYPEYLKVAWDVERGLFRVPSSKVARRHRMGIGTIPSDATVVLRYGNRKTLGTIEERFVSRLKRGDTFTFAGRKLEFVMMKDLVAIVRNTTRQAPVTPAWLGGRMAVTELVGAYLRDELVRGADASPELAALAPLLATQARVSALPRPGETLFETVRTREGQHLFGFPFAGRGVHQGLAALLAHRLARRRAGTFAFSVNDMGFEILGPKGYPFEECLGSPAFTSDRLVEDLREGMNLAELAKGRFRDVAQVAGLVFSGYPGSRKTTRQLQTSTGTLFEVLRSYDPESPLLRQAEREVLEGDLEADRLADTLQRIADSRHLWTHPTRVSPFAFPLLIERLSARLSTEDLTTRIDRMKARWAEA